MKIDRFVIRKGDSRTVDEKLVIYDRKEERNIFEMTVTVGHEKMLDYFVKEIAFKQIVRYYTMFEEFIDENGHGNGRAWDRYYELNKGKIHRSDKDIELLNKVSSMSNEIVEASQEVAIMADNICNKVDS